MMEKRRLFLSLGVGVLTLVGGALAVFYGFQHLERLIPYELPKEKLRFAELRPSSAQEIRGGDGSVLDYATGENDLYLYRPLAQISPFVAEFVVFSEDAKFWTHEGFDQQEIVNSIERNLDSGKIQRGGSTISQQLAKNLFLDRNRSWVRKAFEVPWTLRLERDLTKRQLLELYVNSIEWGQRIRGVEAAARHYFDVSAAELSAAQALFLAAIIPNPVRMDLMRNPRAEREVRGRYEHLVQRLEAEKRRSTAEALELLNANWKPVPWSERLGRYPVFGVPNSQLPFRVQRFSIASTLAKRIPRNQKLSVTREGMSMMALLVAMAVPSAGGKRVWLLWRGEQLVGVHQFREPAEPSDPMDLPDDVQLELADQIDSQNLAF
jgi:monofunctional biosynthetic peptidoglycan transglycosylase